MKQLIFITLLWLLWSVSIQAETTIISVGTFSERSLSGWQEKEFSGKTQYQLLKTDTQNVLKAQSKQSASGLYKEIRINLNQTPYLNWSWQIDSPLKKLNEQSKDGDDYAARLYIVKKHDFLFWKTKALNYVWSSNQDKYSHWNNAYTSQAKMFAVRGNDSKAKQWYKEKRNVKEDFKQFFGDNVEYIDVIAIMTDTDNSKSSVRAYYGDIFFSTQ